MADPARPAKLWGWGKRLPKGAKEPKGPEEPKGAKKAERGGNSR